MQIKFLERLILFLSAWKMRENKLTLKIIIQHIIQILQQMINFAKQLMSINHS
jgi:hypothetical protein